jgi:hypothetical protein
MPRGRERNTCRSWLSGSYYTTRRSNAYLPEQSLSQSFLHGGRLLPRLLHQSERETKALTAVGTHNPSYNDYRIFHLKRYNNRRSSLQHRSEREIIATTAIGTHTPSSTITGTKSYNSNWNSHPELNNHRNSDLKRYNAKSLLQQQSELTPRAQQSPELRATTAIGTHTPSSTITGTPISSATTRNHCYNSNRNSHPELNNHRN